MTQQPPDTSGLFEAILARYGPAVTLLLASLASLAVLVKQLVPKMFDELFRQKKQREKREVEERRVASEQWATVFEANMGLMEFLSKDVQIELAKIAQRLEDVDRRWVVATGELKEIRGLVTLLTKITAEIVDKQAALDERVMSVVNYALPEDGEKEEKQT